MSEKKKKIKSDVPLCIMQRSFIYYENFFTVIYRFSQNSKKIQFRNFNPAHKKVTCMI